MSADDSEGAANARASWRSCAMSTVSTRPLELDAEIVTMERDAECEFMIVVRPKRKAVNLLEWAEFNREKIESALRKNGAVLFRGFDIDERNFPSLCTVITDQMMGNIEESSPRTVLPGGVFTSTEYPGDKEIFLHNEFSYADRFPSKVIFCCITPAEEDGASLLADCRKVYEQIDEPIRRLFSRRRWMYQRHYWPGLGISWEQAFGTNERDIVQRYCSEHNIEIHWEADGHLVTQQTRDVALIHPWTGAALWFNHLVFFNEASMEWSVREQLEEVLHGAPFPHSTFYGDCSVVEPEIIEHIGAAYKRGTHALRLERSDVLMLDNLLVAHGRSTYRGARRVLFACADPLERSKLQLPV